MVGSVLFLGFAGFGMGNKDCFFPDGRDLIVFVGEVEESAEVVRAEGAKVKEM